MDRFLIAPYDSESGLQTDVKPWLISDSAFSDLNNVYVFRGRVRKRFGSQWLNDDKLGTRFRINIGTTDAAGNFGPVNVAALLIDAGFVFTVGMAFSIGNEFFTVVNATPGLQDMLDTGGAVQALFDVTTGNISILGADSHTTNVYFYPALPVMGLLNLEDKATNNEFIIGFDTRYAYHYVNGWERLDGTPPAFPNYAVWTGNNSQFFWGTTWTGADPSNRLFFVTNFKENEPDSMRYYDRVGVQWHTFRPQIDATPNYLFSARIVVVFKNRLVFFNTWEGTLAGFPGNNYVNRCRYSQIGSPIDVNAFRQDIPGRGNAIDCPTTESIITAEFVRDRLIVYCERSTWELVYTGNQAYPFSWQQINTELGAESTFSVIPFDKFAIGVGNVGIHACSGGNVERIDTKIPDQVFKIHNADQGVERVYGIRDYFVEMLYWSFPGPDVSTTQPFPNRVLIYNYKNNTWAFNNDSITVFGYINQPNIINITWDSTSVTWNDPVPWDSGAQQVQHRQIIAGNQEGYTFLIVSDETTNASVMQITNITINADQSLTINSIDHNLRVGDFIYITDIVDNGAPDNLTLLNHTIFMVTNVIDKDNFVIIYPPGTIITGTYRGGGVFARVSRISLKTKQFNFYLKQGVNFSIPKIDFMVDKTDYDAQCKFDVNYFVSTSSVNILSDGIGNNTVTGTGTLDTFPYPLIPYEITSERVIHPVYPIANGEFIQLEISMNDAEMTEVVTVIENGITSYTGPTFVDFQLHFINFYAQRTSSRFE